MREILFRAKKKNNGEWMEGFPVRIYDYGGLVWEMHPFNTNFECSHSVIPETIGQYTGLTDKNGKKIFEGDILRSVYTKKNYPVFYGEYTYINEYGEEEDACGWYDEEFDYGYKLAIGRTEGWAVVIGNIHDNPELLEA